MVGTSRYWPRLVKTPWVSGEYHHHFLIMPMPWFVYKQMGRWRSFRFCFEILHRL